ncbi:probable LRR receptor-like serine/threonine-protein kinase At3g47570 [Mercurialis annua]|uniref:probable LRR receptor-like serine/threonine-protein kinase At3g47570 n=1 Tax=Mercurialis annua TaxID=3986 RepID=UPI002160D8B0|nr:probable LRR receptor-like serine/threonine-protein kinase At3g47570 [Mercurialis annua]
MANMVMAAVTNLSTDEVALVALKHHITSGPDNILTRNWSSSNSIRNWTGLSWSNRHERVTGLDLTDMGLQGTIPSHLGNLSFLKSLILTGNKFYGTLPKELSHLRRLQIIDLSNNSFVGDIPHWLANLTSLQYIVLDFNSFSGSIPPEIGNLHQLWLLALQNNSLSGPIPLSIFNMSSLKGLALSSNRISGNLPDDICHQFQTLEALYLSENMLSGPIPASLAKCSNLQLLSLSENGFTGSIPKHIGNLTALTNLYLNRNHLTGTIPHEMGNLVNLGALSMPINNLRGSIPPTIFNLSNVRRFLVADNQLSGNLPSIIDLPSLQTITLSGNKLTGKFPASFSNCSKLITLQSSDNYFSGHIPNSLGNLRMLQILDISYNNVTADSGFFSSMASCINLNTLQVSVNPLDVVLPNSIGNMSSLQSLVAGLCKIRGNIPVQIGNLSTLMQIDLSANELTGSIPLSFWRLTRLLDLNLSSNSLNGSLRLDIGNLKLLIDMDLSRNQISGPIPGSIGDLKDLQHLSLAENDFQGSIPQPFGDIVALISLNLSTNNLSGSIPKSLEALLNLKSFDVSSNRLQGEIPSGGSFGNLSYESFKSNAALCALPRFRVPPCDTSKKSKTSNLHLLDYILPTLVISLSLIVAFTIIFTKINKKRNQEALLPLATWKRFSFLQLEEATARFSDSNLLGKGGFGSVYKGSLSDGTNVAVKVFNLQEEGVLKSFNTECEVLRNIRHRNLVRVISSCCNLDFKALILEFMPNGSLEKWLYSYNYFLDIQQRLHIMIGVASALEYLHSYTTPIVHCDLKPNNILLDQDKEAHVSNFGIAKLLSGDNCMTQTLTLATIGYMAPEYGEAGIVSARGDVYSFGILMIETFTRKKPTDEIFSGEMSIKQWVRNAFPDAVVQVVDCNLLDVEEEKQFIANINCVSSILGLALDCCADLLEERVNMKEVLSILEKIKIQFLKHFSQV